MSFMKMFRRSFSGKPSKFPIESGQFVIPKDSLLYRNDYDPILSDVSRELLLSTDKKGSESISPRSWNSSPMTSSTDEDDGGSDTKETYKRNTRVLNSALNDYRRRQKKLTKKQKNIVAMDTEIEELLRMIKLFKLQTDALDLEKDRKRLEMATLCNNISPGDESEVKKKEPILFRKYNNIKTSKDAKSLTELISRKKTALQKLEILTYRKYMSLNHGIKLNETSLPGNKITNDDFEKAFDSVRDSIDDVGLRNLYTVSQNEVNDDRDKATTPTLSRVTRAVIRGRYGHLFGSTPV